MTDAAPRQSALRDSSIYFVAQLGARVLNFIYFVLLTSALPIDEFGVLNYALSIIVLLDILVDLGLSRHATREVSKDQAAAGAFIRRLIPFKLVATTAVFALFCLVVAVSDLPSNYKIINICAAIGLYFTAPAMLFESILQAHQRFGLISLAHIALSVLQFAVGGAILWLGGSTVWIALTFALTHLIYAGVMSIGLMDILRNLPAQADFAALRRSIPSAFPYMISAVVIMFAIRAEFVVLGFFGTKEDLAVFGMATKIVEASLLVPLAFMTVMTPRFSQAHILGRNELSRLYLSGLEIILLVSIPLGLIAIWLVPVAQFILSAEGYGRVDDILYVVFLGFPAASVFLYNTAALFGAVNQTRPLVILTSLGACQIGINIVLQSQWGIWGAATAFVAFMMLAAITTTIAILFIYARVSAVWSALLAPAAGTLPAAGIMVVFGVSALGLCLAAFAFVVCAWGLRRMGVHLVTDLDVTPRSTA